MLHRIYPIALGVVAVLGFLALGLWIAGVVDDDRVGQVGLKAAALASLGLLVIFMAHRRQKKKGAKA